MRPTLQIPAWVVMGTAIAVFSVTQSANAGNALSGREVVQRVCSGCHGTGANGAPRIGDKEAWSARAVQGLSALTTHAIEGIRKMPAHGGQPGLSDLELARAITYMVNQSGGHWVPPVTAADLMSERSGEQVVETVCSKCHQEGKFGAPRIGDMHAWALRLRNGIPYAVRSAIHGHGGMPPRGGVANLTDQEIRNAILYMFNPKAATVSGASSSATSAQPSAGLNHAVAGGVDMYLGYMSAEQLRAYPAGAPERKMHGGVPKGENWYHLNVSLLREDDHTPVTGAEVEASVQEVGVSTQSRKLEPIPIGQGSYGNYFQMRPKTLYRITIKVKTSGSTEPVRAEFQHEYD